MVAIAPAGEKLAYQLLPMVATDMQKDKDYMPSAAFRTEVLYGMKIMQIDEKGRHGLDRNVDFLSIIIFYDGRD